MTKRNWITSGLIVLSTLIVVGSIVYMTYLSRRVAQEEQLRIGIWAEATERLIQADEDEDVDFYSTIIEQNTSIPVYMVDTAGNILLSRNVDEPVADPRTLHGPIEVRIPNGEDEIIQYIYYDDSDLIWQLRYFPYIILFLIAVFVGLLIALVRASQHSEQNRVWVGMSKETAHQLGTPISSLNGWINLLEDKYPDETMLREVHRDIDRLNIIADRFSKIGSKPTLRDENIDEVTAQAVEYMRVRLGKRGTISYESNGEIGQVKLSAPLMSWVIENLIKNAIDAGATEIKVTRKDYTIDIADNGHGIPGRNPGRVFRPGYTTKQRGWGLGLSLAKRIVEQYHHGRLRIAHTEEGKGTTFRIELRREK